MPSVTLVAGVSGAGKTVVVKALLQKYPHLVVPVAFATRDPREGEVDGVDYHFVTKELYQSLVEKGDLLTNIKYNNQHYGYPKSAFSENRPIVATIDITGIAQVRRLYPTAKAVFLDEFPEVQTQRISKRESPESVLVRLAIAETERNWAYAHSRSVILVPPGLSREEKFALLERIIFDENQCE